MNDSAAAAGDFDHAQHSGGWAVYNPVAVARRLLSDVRAFWDELVRDYGIRFVVVLVSVYFCMKGLANNATSYALLPYYKRMDVSDTQYQTYFNVANMAFSLKPLVGIISDQIPLFGYHKRFYAAGLCVACVAVLLLNTLVIEHIPGAAGPGTAAMFFVFFVGIAGVDLLIEGKYSELMNRLRASPAAITFVWLCFSAGALVGSVIEGPMADALIPEAVMWVAAPFLIFPAVVTALGWIPEERVQGPCSRGAGSGENGGENGGGGPDAMEGGGALTSENEHGEASLLANAQSPTDEKGAFSPTDYGTKPPLPTAPPSEEGANTLLVKAESSSARQHKGLLLLGGLTAAASVMMAVLSLLTTPLTLVAVILPSAAILLAFSFFVLPRPVAMANLFMFLRELCYMQITGYLDYFYTGDSQCVPGGPNFSFTYYQTLVNVLSAVGTMVGSVLFQKFLSGMSFRRVFWVSTSLKIAASSFDLILTRRWNIAAGINDHVVFICGDAIIYPICTMLDFMPSAVLLSRLCPRGVEATMFALLAASSNFGVSISRAIGTLVAGRLGITSTKNHCDFSNLYLLVIIGHMAMPAAVYVFSCILIPDVPMSTPLCDEDEDGDAPTAAESEIRQALAAQEGGTRGSLAVPAASVRSSRRTRRGPGEESDHCDDGYTGSSYGAHGQGLQERDSVRAADDINALLAQSAFDGEEGRNASHNVPPREEGGAGGE